MYVFVCARTREGEREMRACVRAGGRACGRAGVRACYIARNEYDKASCNFETSSIKYMASDRAAQLSVRQPRPGLKQHNTPQQDVIAGFEKRVHTSCASGD